MSVNRDSSSPEWVVSGQNLLTGEVVYLSATGWAYALKSARIFDVESEVTLTLETIQTQDRLILFPEKLRILRGADGRPTPDNFREAIRAIGPSNRFHGKQAESGEVNHV